MSEWDVTTLGLLSKKRQIEIRTGPFGTQLHQSDYVDNGIPVVIPKDILDWKICTNTIARTSSEMIEKLQVHQLRFGDIVYGRRGDIGRHAFVTKEEVGYLCGTGCIRLRLLNDAPIIPRFLSFYLRLPDTINSIYNQAVGSTMANLNTSIIENISVNYPQIDTQNKIVAALAAYDDLIENNNCRIAILEEMAQKLYREWFVHFRFPGHENVKMLESEMGLIPEGWTVQSPKEVADHYIGGGWGKESCGNALQPAFVIRGTDIPKARQNDIGNCPLRYHTKPNLKDRCLSNGDIVIEVSGGSKGQPVGRPLLITSELLDSFNGQQVICASFCKLYRCNATMINPYYVYLWLLEIYKNGEIEKYQSQSTGIINFKFEYFLDSPVILLPQTDVQTAFYKQVETIFKQINNLGKKNTNLRKTRDLLLPGLISGDIDVSELDISTKEG